MSHKTKRNYIIYTLSKLTDYELKLPGVIKTRELPYICFGWVPRYYTKEEMISRLVSNWYYTNKKDAMLNNLSTDMSEIKTDYVIRESNDCIFGHRHWTEYGHKYFIAKQTKDGITAVNLDSMQKDITEAIKRFVNKREKSIKRMEAVKRAEQFKFRRGSVANTSCGRWHRGTYYRIPKLKNVVTQNSSCEEDTKEFVKSKYKTKNLPVWDDRVRHYDKSWKTSCKIKKQWMKHLDNHTSTDISIKDITKASLVLDEDI